MLYELFYEFAVEMREWELAWAPKIIDTDAAPSDLEKMERECKKERDAILRKYCSAKHTRCLLSVTDPPIHNPAGQSLIREKVAADKKSGVLDLECRDKKDKASFGVKSRYQFVNVKSKWLIERKWEKWPDEGRFTEIDVI